MLEGGQPRSCEVDGVGWLWDGENGENGVDYSAAEELGFLAARTACSQTKWELGAPWMYAVSI
jgi:hypothetical protein